MKLTTEQIAHYREHGYVALPPIIDDDELGRQRATFDRLFTPPTDGGKPLYYDLTGDDPNKQITDASVPQLLHPSHHVKELPQSAAWQTAIDIATQLLDMSDCSRDELILRDHMIVKPPHSTGSTPWHQDEAYWEEDLDYQELSVWIALQDTTEQMGCMQFIPGSHKREVAPHHSWKNDPKIVALEVDDGHIDAGLARPCPLSAGGATVHHSRTLHFTSGNTTDQPRRALILTVGTPPRKLSKPRDFYWNRKEHHFEDHIIDPAEKA